MGDETDIYEKEVIEAANKWYSYVLRRSDGLNPHERDLFDAIFLLKKNVVKKEYDKIPKPKLERPTTPMPFEMIENLIKKMNDDE